MGHRPPSVKNQQMVLDLCRPKIPQASVKGLDVVFTRTTAWRAS